MSAAQSQQQRSDEVFTTDSSKQAAPPANQPATNNTTTCNKKPGTDKENNAKQGKSEDKKSTLNSPRLISSMKPLETGNKKPAAVGKENLDVTKKGQTEKGGKKEGKKTLESPSLIKDVKGVNGNIKATAPPKRTGSFRAPADKKKPVVEKKVNGTSTARRPSTDGKRSDSAGSRPSENGRKDSKEEPKRKNSADSSASSSSLSSAGVDKTGKINGKPTRRIVRTPSLPDRQAAKTTESNVKGGFLAPTQAWLSHMGDKIDVKSRSPSPMRKEGHQSVTVPRKPVDRSVSPGGRRARDSSADSEKKSRSVTGPRTTRKPVEKDPSLPSVKRTSSMRAGASKPVVTSAPVKRSESLKKPVPSTTVKKDLSRKANGKIGGKANNNVGQKKEPPPVPPKPDRVLIDNALDEMHNSTNSLNMDATDSNSKSALNSNNNIKTNKGSLSKNTALKNKTNSKLLLKDSASDKENEVVEKTTVDTTTSESVSEQNTNTSRQTINLNQSIGKKRIVQFLLSSLKQVVVVDIIISPFTCDTFLHNVHL